MVNNKELEQNKKILNNFVQNRYMKTENSDAFLERKAQMEKPPTVIGLTIFKVKLIVAEIRNFPLQQTEVDIIEEFEESIRDNSDSDLLSGEQSKFYDDVLAIKVKYKK